MAKREEILEAATKIFYEKGYQSTTMNDMANEIGLSKSAIYHYFKSKEDLLVEIYDKAITDAVNELSKTVKSDKCTIDKLQEITANQIERIIIEKQPMMKTFFQEEGQLPEKFFKSIKKRKREFNRLVEDIFIKGVSEGVFKKGDPELFVNAFLGMCLWVYKWYKPNTKYTPKDITEYFVKLLEEGYLASDSKGLAKEIDTVSESGNSVENVTKRIRYHISMIEILNKELDILIQNKAAEKNSHSRVT